MPSKHSAIVGGSSAARVLNCPGSNALLAQMPEVTDRDSFFSTEGTALHTAMEMLITGQATLETIAGTVIETRSGPITITSDLVHDALAPAWTYWIELLPMIDTWQLETEVAFPGIDGAFGTADVLARDDEKNITYVTDWKFGSGEPIKAVYEDPDDPDTEFVNEQLMFYAVAARHTQPAFFPKNCKIVLTIVQPRARGQAPISSAKVTMDELNDFTIALHEAVAEARRPTAPTVKGRWCRFQRCQAICPHFTGPLIDLEVINKMPEQTSNDYMSTLLNILDMAPAVESLIREARAQAHILLGNGEEVPGWKLVAKRGTRQWTVGEEELAKKLKALKLKKADLYDVTLKSPAGVEKVLPKKTKLPDGLTTTVSSGTTIAPVIDKRPAISGDPNALSKIMLEVLGDDV